MEYQLDMKVLYQDLLCFGAYSIGMGDHSFEELAAGWPCLLLADWMHSVCCENR